MSTPSTPESDGADLVLREIREEASHLAHHPVDELHRLAHVAAEGESPTTPMLATFGVLLFVGAIFAVLLTAAMLVYYYA